MMDMRDEVEQIILRTMVKEGMDAAPQDYEFLMKYNLKDLFLQYRLFDERSRNRPEVSHTGETKESNHRRYDLSTSS